MTTSATPLRGLFIGEGGLLVACADAWRTHGHVIEAVVTGNRSVARWADDGGITRLPPAGDLAASLSGRAFDYLFSIVNPRVTPTEVLRMCRRAAINYHDSPLPRYAGFHVTSWAIIAGERSHGVTWHEMTEQVDAGRILAQQTIAIAPDETALSLNTKCHDAALASFQRLLDDLAAGRLSPQPQDQTARSYFPRLRRPPAASVLAWDRPAEELDALGRALSFGSESNPLGLPKIVGDAGAGAVLVTAFTIAAIDERRPAAGVVGRIGDDALVIGTATRPLAIQAAATLDGRPLTPRALAAQLGLAEGKTLPLLGAAVAHRLVAVDTLAARHESFWVDRLASLHPAAVPTSVRPATVADDDASATATSDAAPPAGSARPRQRLRTALPPALAALPAGDAVDRIVAGLAALLARLGQDGPFDVAYRDAELDRLLADDTGTVSRLFASALPLRLTVDTAVPFDELLAA
ncbi:MAG: hypothetical protein QOI66_3284, partial [Myxococcales bacterium]|nr:hypothetical protein [Myxococcales bacterium]